MKRRRDDDDDPEANPQSSPSNTSSRGEGDMADTETDTGQAARQEGGTPTRQGRQTRREEAESSSQAQVPPPAKKKRTRTLTTPHQSSVLHALLAQSRFPTTAMREEVGRSIGLSARKVQVWFQNQRQKARRPRTQDVSQPLSRPPQYGAFTNTPGSSSTLSAAPQAGPSLYRGGDFGLPYGQRPSAPLDYRDSGDALRTRLTSASSGSSGHLSGPGVPGPSTIYAPRFPPPPQNIPTYATSPTRAHHHAYPERWTSRPGTMGGGDPFLQTEQARGYAPHRDMSLNLPPLVLDESRAAMSSLRTLPPLEVPALPSLPRRYPISERSPDSLPFAYPASSSVAGPSRLRSPPAAAVPGPSTSTTLHELPRLRIPLSSAGSPHSYTPPYPPFTHQERPVPASSRYYDDPFRASPTSLWGGHGHTPSPQEGTPRPPSPFPVIRTTRFDPVRAALGENEEGGSPGRPPSTHDFPFRDDPRE